MGNFRKTPLIFIQFWDKNSFLNEGYQYIHGGGKLRQYMSTL